MSFANAFAGHKILVVDDEPDSREVATILLEMAGAEVIEASDGEHGLAAAREHKPVFILADLSMPEMSGWQLLHHLKQDETIADIPVIALTAHAMAGDKERVLAAGFYSYMAKPLRPETFVDDLLKLVADIPAIAQTHTGD